LILVGGKVLADKVGVPIGVYSLAISLSDIEVMLLTTNISTPFARLHVNDLSLSFDAALNPTCFFDSSSIKVTNQRVH
jgi:hypothetical protein